MKKVKDELRREYRLKDLKGGVRGKYFEQYKAGTNLVLLLPEVAKFFSTDRAVNDALLSLVYVAKKTASLTLRSSGRAKARRSTYR